MPDPRLVAIVTALILAWGGSAARAEYGLEELLQIENYILQKDCAGLWQYLLANPAIMEGEDALARELRVFVDATQRGQIECFSARSAANAVPLTGPVVNFAPSSGVVY